MKTQTKVGATKAATVRWPVLNAALNKIEATTHALELAEGRYAHFKYLEAVYRFYWKSKEKGKRKRDRNRICRLRGLQLREDVCLFGTLIMATTKISKSTRSKYVIRLQQAIAAAICPDEIRAFLRQPKKSAAHKPRTVKPPRLRLVQTHT